MSRPGNEPRKPRRPDRAIYMPRGRLQATPTGSGHQACEPATDHILPSKQSSVDGRKYEASDAKQRERQRPAEQHIKISQRSQQINECSDVKSTQNSKSGEPIKVASSRESKRRSHGSRRVNAVEGADKLKENGPEKTSSNVAADQQRNSKYDDFLRKPHLRGDTTNTATSGCQDLPVHPNHPCDSVLAKGIDVQAASSGRWTSGAGDGDDNPSDWKGQSVTITRSTTDRCGLPPSRPRPPDQSVHTPAVERGHQQLGREFSSASGRHRRRAGGTEPRGGEHPRQRETDDVNTEVEEVKYFEHEEMKSSKNTTCFSYSPQNQATPISVYDDKKSMMMMEEKEDTRASQNCQLGEEQTFENQPELKFVNGASTELAEEACRHVSCEDFPACDAPPATLSDEDCCCPSATTVGAKSPTLPDWAHGCASPVIPGIGFSNHVSDVPSAKANSPRASMPVAPTSYDDHRDSSNHHSLTCVPGASRRYTPSPVEKPFTTPPLERSLASQRISAKPQDGSMDLDGERYWPPPSSGAGGVLHVPGVVQSRRHPSRQQPPAPAHTRHLFDPNNPSKPLPVVASVDSSSRRRLNSSALPQGHGYASSPYPTEELPSWPAARSGAENANGARVSQLLGRAVGDVEYVVGTGRLLTDWSHVCTIREHVQQECRQLIRSDLRTWVALGVDQVVWRSLYYSVIERLRAAAGGGSASQPPVPGASDPIAAHHLLESLISEGMEFFADLLQSLQTSFRLPVEQLGSLTFDPSTLAGHRYVSVVAVVSQRLLLCLGDLARYKHHNGRVANLSEAHSYYLQAQRMNPKNGRPFNQLAILALYAHKRLDCVYFYMRALNASNPFVTARESLLALFHESASKYAARSRGPAAGTKAERRHHRGWQQQAAARTETWVQPGAQGRRVQRTLRPDSDSDEDDAADDDGRLADLSDTELMKMFITSYLHVQGKLYTRVGLEDFEAVSRDMLRQFSHVLSRRPMPLKQVDVLHLLAINMFNIENSRLRDERLSTELRSTYQELALSVALEMAAHVLQTTCRLLAEQAQQPAVTGTLFPEADLQTCIVFVKVWCDWLLCSSGVWSPAPCTREFRVRRLCDGWSSLARLTNLLRQRDVPGIKLHQTASQNGAVLPVVRVQEDIYLQGFKPLDCADHQPLYVDETLCELELARDLVRLRRILFVCEEYLCGLEPAVLRLTYADDATPHYVAEVSSHAGAAEARQQPPPPRCASPPSEPDVLVELVEPVSPEEPGLPERPDLRRLRKQKLALEQRARQQEEQHRRLQEIVTASGRVSIEVRPRHLVADTNCYVDYLQQLMQVVSQNSSYTLTVPVTVVSELDGLAAAGRRPRPGQTAQHVQNVRRTAAAALQFIRAACGGDAAAATAGHVRCVTTRGHVLNSAAYTAEQEDDDQLLLTNDDKILECCAKLERGSSTTNPDGTVQLSREVVLLTDDRNLRLKALALDVPTRTVPDFVAWSSLR